MIFNILSLADRQVLSLLVAPIKHDLHLTDTQFGLLVGLAFAILYCLAGLPIGWLADRISRKLILWIGVTVWSLGAAISGLAQTMAHLFGGRMAVGVGEAALAPCSFSMIGGLFPRSRQSLAFGLYMTASSLGGAVALGLGGLLLGLFEKHPLVLPVFGAVAPWRGVFLAIGLPGVILAMLAWTTREPRPTPAPPPEPDTAPVKPVDFWVFVSERRGMIIRHFLGFPVLGAAVYGVSLWAPAFFGRKFGIPPQEIGPILGLSNLIMSSLVSTGAGALIDRLTARGMRDATFVVPMIQVCLGVPILFFALLTPSKELAVAAFFVGAPLYSAWGAGSMSSLQIISPAPIRGRMGALYVFMLSGVGFSLGPFLVAAVTDHVLHDEAKVGLSMLIVVAVLAPLALISLGSGRSRLREIALENDGLDAAEAALASSHQRL